MKDKANITSRRAMLQIGVRSLAGAGLIGTLEQTAGAASADRALVCIYLFGGEGASYLPDVAELKALHRQEVLAVVKHRASRSSAVMAERYEALRFLPNGFATLEWAAQRAGIRPLTGAGAFTFQSGVSLVALGGNQPQGDQFENTTLRQAMNNVAPRKTSFPDTTIGRQLEDVSRLLQASRSLGLNRPVFVCTANGFTRSARQARTVAKRYRELGQALAAFHAATVELGLDRQVTTYTDAEFSAEGSPRMASRLILGGAAMESGILKSASIAADTYSDSLARWHGLA
jgi:uncharacterized protein (DUF1501 family)